MKLYIPTSSLNFNNIMSCESVSPIVFYTKRNFGYKMFEKIELNCFNNSLLIYEKIPEYQIPKSELVNFPMVIEVIIDPETNGLERVKNDIWQIDRTVYLNPIDSKIYFLTQEHKKTILLRSESSVETKLVNLYRRNIKVYQQEKKKYHLEGLSDLPGPNLQEIENDRQRNRLKGFAYAYIIAANNSSSKEIIKLKNLVNQITNLSSAIVNSASGFGTPRQNDELEKLLQNLNEYQYNDIKMFLKSLLPEKHNEVWDRLYNHFGVRIPNRYSFEKYFHSLTDKKKYEASLQEIEEWCKKIEQEYLGAKTGFEWSTISIAGNRLTQYEDPFITKGETKGNYQNLINDIFVSTDITESSFSSERSRLADEITRKIKSYITEDWDSSSAKLLLNSLRRNLAGQEAFNIKWDTGLISAIGAFILKGEDFEKLNDFFISSEIEDGRLAFGFYGCICGYANLSRMFTSRFYEADIQYVTKTYKAIYKQLHNIELPGDLPKEEITKIVTADSQMNAEKKGDMTLDNQAILLMLDIKENVPEFLKLSTGNKEFYESRINRLYDGKVSKGFIQALESVTPKTRTKTAWKKVISYLSKKEKSTSNDKSKTKYPTLTQTSMFVEEFYLDDNALSYIATFIPASDYKEVGNEIEWIQKVHRNNGYKKKDGSWVPLEKHSNEEVINHLKNNAQGRISPKTLEKLIGGLRKKYCS